MIRPSDPPCNPAMGLIAAASAVPCQPRQGGGVIPLSPDRNHNVMWFG